MLAERAPEANHHQSLHDDHYLQQTSQIWFECGLHIFVLSSFYKSANTKHVISNNILPLETHADTQKVKGQEARNSEER